MNVNTIALLLVCQLVGDTLARLLSLPVPGPVIGMLLLFVALLLYGGIPPSLAKTADSLLPYLGLLFVPAGAGVVQYFSDLEQQRWILVVSLTISLVLSLVATGLLIQALRKRWSDE